MVRQIERLAAADAELMLDVGQPAVQPAEQKSEGLTFVLGGLGENFRRQRHSTCSKKKQFQVAEVGCQGGRLVLLCTCTPNHSSAKKTVCRNQCVRTPPLRQRHAVCAAPPWKKLSGEKLRPILRMSWRELVCVARCV